MQQGQTLVKRFYDRERIVQPSEKSSQTNCHNLHTAPQCTPHHTDHRLPHNSPAQPWLVPLVCTVRQGIAYHGAPPWKPTMDAITNLPTAHRPNHAGIGIPSAARPRGDALIPSVWIPIFTMDRLLPTPGSFKIEKVRGDELHHYASNSEVYRSPHFCNCR